MFSARGQGEGSIYQRADGWWVASVNLGWRAGKRARKVFYGKTRKEAQAADHIVPLEDGGKSTADNARSACTSCNNKRRYMEPPDAA